MKQEKKSLHLFFLSFTGVVVVVVVVLALHARHVPKSALSH